MITECTGVFAQHLLFVHELAHELAHIDTWVHPRPFSAIPLPLSLHIIVFLHINSNVIVHKQILIS